MSIENIRRLKEQANEPKPKKLYQIPRVSKKRQNKLEDQKELAKLDEAFYKDVWASSAHVCQNCDCRLPRTPYNWMFHHILPKAQYPAYRHTPENIAILCLMCHSKCETNIDFAPLIKLRRQEAENNCHKWNT